jgi:hypothetical protein
MEYYSTGSSLPSTIDANFGPTISLCTINYKLESYDSNLSTWVDLTAAGTYSSFPWRNADSDFTEGALTVNYPDNSNDYVPYRDFSIRITYTSVYSKLAHS